MQPDTQLGRYRIVGKLGEGGMGAVYRAVDPSLKRDVAIKVLPPEVATDPDRLARLEREAQVLASLEHPNIAAIYGLEEAEGLRFLVMQLAAGTTLDERLAQGPMPPDEVVPIAVQIARGLEAAHESGIVHRDLKPANVMLDDAGNVKLLDFGLAKPTGGSEDSVELTASPTMLEATRTGMILGTAAYMSPEQARGRRVDKRTDIWAWGCVVWEMLTGRRLFAGDSVSDIIAAVLRQEIDLGELPASTPASLRRLVRRALVRDASERLRDIGDARIALTHPEAAPEIGLGPTRPASLAVAAGAVAVGLLLGGLATWWALQPAPPLVRQLDLAPEGLQTGPLVTPALSPDGRRILYRAGDRLWVRDLSQPTGRPIPDTDDVEVPFWAPDSETFAFLSHGRLWKQSLSGGAAIELATFPDFASGAGGSWDPVGRLLVAQGSSDIFAVPARGGEVVRLLVPDPDRGEGHFHRPAMLPDGSFVYIVHRVDATADTIGASRNGERHNLLTLDGDYLGDLAYSPEGALVLSRSGAGNDGIWVLPFDARALEFTGDPVMLVPGAAWPSLSADGTTLVYNPEPAGPATNGRARLALVANLSGSGNPVDSVETLTPFESLMIARQGQRLSPDGSKLVFSLVAEGRSDLWLLDLTTGTRSQVTNDAAFESEPAWSTDGEWIYYTRNDIAVARVRSDGTGDVESLGPGRAPVVIPGSDRLIVSRRGESVGEGDELWFLEARPGGSAEPFHAGRNIYGSASVSPDGRLVAYAMDENGWQVLVEDLESGTRWKVSDGVARAPRWFADGALYYVADSRVVTRVRMTRGTDGTPAFDAPEPVLELTPTFGNLDVTPVRTDDGLRFLTFERESVTHTDHLVVVLNADRMIREALDR